jgi:hypothetical protein
MFERNHVLALIRRQQQQVQSELDGLAEEQGTKPGHDLLFLVLTPRVVQHGFRGLDRGNTVVRRHAICPPRMQWLSHC